MNRPGFPGDPSLERIEGNLRVRVHFICMAMLKVDSDLRFIHIGRYCRIQEGACLVATAEVLAFRR